MIMDRPATRSQQWVPAATAVLLGVAATAAPPARAVTRAEVSSAGLVVTFEAAPGQANDLEITRWSTGEYSWTYRLDDVVPLRIVDAPGRTLCTHPVADDLTVVECRAGESPQDGGPALQVRLGDGDDVAFVAAYTGDVYGRHSAFLDAGPGNDVVVVRWVQGPVRGGPGDDLLVGGHLRDRLDGGPGADRLLGRGSRDELRGGDGRDVLYGNGDVDQLLGGRGDDTLYGGPGADVLDGGPGRDRLWQD